MADTENFSDRLAKINAAHQRQDSTVFFAGGQQNPAHLQGHARANGPLRKIAIAAAVIMGLSAAALAAVPFLKTSNDGESSLLASGGFISERLEFFLGNEHDNSATRYLPEAPERWIKISYADSIDDARLAKRVEAWDTQKRDASFEEDRDVQSYLNKLRGVKDDAQHPDLIDAAMYIGQSSILVMRVEQHKRPVFSVDETTSSQNKDTLIEALESYARKSLRDPADTFDRITFGDYDWLSIYPEKLARMTRLDKDLDKMQIVEVLTYTDPKTELVIEGFAHPKKLELLMSGIAY